MNTGAVHLPRRGSSTRDLATRSRIGGATAIVVCIGVTACASYSASPTPLRSPTSYGSHASDGGITVGAAAVDDPKVSERFFGEDVTAGFTPVQLSFESKTKERFAIDRRRITLACGPRVLKPAGAVVMYHEYKNDVGAAAALGGWAGASDASDANEAMLIDWQQKELPVEAKIRSGERSGGWVYFAGRCRAGSRKLRLPLEAPSRDLTIVLELP